jgi:hypothetical protein
MAGTARQALARHPDPTEDASAQAIFARELGVELRRHMSESEARRYELAIPTLHNYMGLARYWRKQARPAS